MKQMKRIVGFVFILMAFVTVHSAQAQAQNSQEILKQYIADLNKNFTDDALFEKVIKFVQAMDPKPAIPAEAVRFANRGEYAAKTAKSDTDYIAAADEYMKAFRLAPWVAEYHFNNAVLWEKVKNGEGEAVFGFKRYLMAAPDAKDAAEVQKRIDGLQYAEEKRIKDMANGGAAPQNNAEDWVKKLDGAKFVYDAVSPVQIIEIKDGMLIRSRGESAEFGPGSEFGRWPIHSHIVDSQVSGGYSMYSFKISDDGETIEEDHPGDQSNPPFIFHRSR